MDFEIKNYSINSNRKFDDETGRCVEALALSEKKGETMLNRYEGICYYCKAIAPAKGGECFKVNGYWKVAHLSCRKARKAEVVVIRFSSGEEIYQNKNGRCIDAPCCGCCS